jgi:hypothetical protein
MPDEISVILTCSNQGRSLHQSARSVAAAISAVATELKLKCEYLFSPYQITAETEEYLAEHLPAGAQKIAGAAAGEATAINKAIEQARGKFIALVSAFDLVPANWLIESYRAALQQSQPVVLHPASVIFYGASRLLFITPDQGSPDFTNDFLWCRNAWPAVSFGATELFRANPFMEPDRDNGFDQTHWHWSCETVAASILHSPVKNTFSCCRQSDEHSCLTPEARTYMMPPSKLFRKALALEAGTPA